MTDVSDFIEHYGVKGQRWGVRNKSKITLGKKDLRTSTESKRASEVLRKARKHGISSLTNKELGDLNKRLDLERKFSSVGPKSKLNVGANFVKSSLSVGRSVNDAVAFANSPAGKFLKENLKKKG